MRDLDQRLRESLRDRAEDVEATTTAPAQLATRVRQRRRRKIAVLASTATVVALVVGVAGLQIAGGDDAQQVTPAATSSPTEIVAQRADGAIVVVETATRTEIRELVPPGQVDIAYRDNYIVSPDGQSVYYVESPSGADVEIFMNVDVSDTQLAELQALLEADADVASVEFIDRDAALTDFERIFADDPSLLENVGPEDLPPSFRIDATSPRAKDAITDRYSESAGVDTVVSAPGGFAPGSQMVASPIFRVGIAGGAPEEAAVGTNPTISADGAILAVGSVSGDSGDLGATDGITLYDIETGEARTAHSEAAEMVWPAGWVDDSTLVVGGLGASTFQPGIDTSPSGIDRYLLDVADPDLHLRPDGALDVDSSSFVTNHGSVITSAPAPGGSGGTRFLSSDLLGSGPEREIGSVGFAATALDVDSAEVNVLFAGTREKSSDDRGEPIDGSVADAFVGYLDEDHEVHELGSDYVWARWVPGENDRSEPTPETTVSDVQIPEDSAVVTLGPLVRAGEPNSETGEVGVGMRCGSTCGLWLTYTLAETADGWRVKGNLPTVSVS